MPTPNLLLQQLFNFLQEAFAVMPVDEPKRKVPESLQDAMLEEADIKMVGVGATFEKCIKNM